MRINQMYSYLSKRYPCREDTINSLVELICDCEEAFPSAIYLYGHSGTGKTAIIKDFLRHCRLQQPMRVVHLNCVESYTSKILFEQILDELSVDSIDNVPCESRADNLREFIEQLKRWHDPSSLELENRPKGFIIALDNAERLRDMDANILPVLLQLQHLVGLNLCVVFISQLPFEKYYCKTGLSEVITLHFPQYTKAETLRILSADYANVKQLLETQLLQHANSREEMLTRYTHTIETITLDFFNNYLNLFLSVFYKACRDLPELKLTARKCFFKYVEPVLDGSVEASDVSRLWRNIASSLRNALAQVYMRMDKSEEKISNVEAATPLSDQTARHLAKTLELPYYGKYLLIAAFLASHNSAKEDKRLFVKHHGKQRKRMQTVNAKSKITEKMSTSLGPKSFSIDRLLAIFYAILDEKVGLTCNLLSQISTLVHFKLLSYVSGENNVMEGSSRLQCTVGLEFVVHIGKVVGFNVRQYLCDFM